MIKRSYRSSRVLREATKFLCITSFGIGLAWLPAQAPSTAQSCNVFGCSQPGAAACNPFGCPSQGAGECNPFGCPNPGASACTPFGCPASPQRSSEPPPSSTQNAPASDRRNFVAYNKTNQTITALYLSPTDSNSWGGNILSDVLRSESYTRVTFSDNSERCVYDLKAVYGDKTYDRNRFNLCETTTVEFTGNGGDYTPK